MKDLFNNTVCAISSPPGVGAISVIRLTGEKSHQILTNNISSKSKYENLKAGKLLFTKILADGNILDEVLLVKFDAPNSFTGENMLKYTVMARISYNKRFYICLLKMEQIFLLG